jgi:hypothetical protein
MQKKTECTPRGDRTLDLWIRSPSRYPLRYRGDILIRKNGSISLKVEYQKIVKND